MAPGRPRPQVWCIGALCMLLASPLVAQDSTDKPKASVELYGYLQADAIFDESGINPISIDAMRPTRLPSYENQYGKPGNFAIKARQSRIGIKPRLQSPIGEIKGVFEVDMFGVGPDEGLFTLRVRHVYAEVGQFLVGQTHTLMMNIDMFPNSIEYWGPNGMVFVRLPQFRWTPINRERPDVRSERDPRDPRSTQRQKPTRTWLAFALESPGASADVGRFSEVPDINDVKFRYPVPDLTGQAHVGWPGIYFELGAALGYVKWDDMAAASRGVDLSGDGVRWGLNLTTAINTGKFGTLRLGASHGDGAANRMNDASDDVAIRFNQGDPAQPIEGGLVPITGITAFYDIYWSPRWTSTMGYSYVHMENLNGQLPTAFRDGHYALVNILWHPVPSMLFGPEAQYVGRKNYDGFTSGGFRLQVSGKWAYSYMLGGRS